MPTGDFYITTNSTSTSTGMFSITGSTISWDTGATGTWDITHQYQPLVIPEMKQRELFPAFND